MTATLNPYLTAICPMYLQRSRQNNAGIRVANKNMFRLLKNSRVQRVISGPNRVYSGCTRRHLSFTSYRDPVIVRAARPPSPPALLSTCRDVWEGATLRWRIQVILNISQINMLIAKTPAILATSLYNSYPVTTKIYF